jgi:hypothetical protein
LSVIRRNPSASSSQAGGFEMVAETGVRSEMGVPNVAFQP